MKDFDAHRPFNELADLSIAEAGKENVAEAARILAMNVAHYELKFGDLPLENFAELMRTQTIDPETAKLLSEAMQNLVGALR